jgi:hypothetical protein
LLAFLCFGCSLSIFFVILNVFQVCFCHWPSLGHPKLKCPIDPNFYYGCLYSKCLIRQCPILGCPFKNLNQLILLLNDHNGLKAQETLEMLDLLGLKITFLMKIKFNSI